MKKTYKLLCFLMVLILLIGSIPVSASDFTPPETLYYGDVDFDGEVTIKDATLIQKYIAQLVSFTTVQRFLADIYDKEQLEVKKRKKPQPPQNNKKKGTVNHG